jgi:hypothetical protein
MFENFTLGLCNILKNEQKPGLNRGSMLSLLSHTATCTHVTNDPMSNFEEAIGTLLKFRIAHC